MASSSATSDIQALLDQRGGSMQVNGHIRGSQRKPPMLIRNDGVFSDALPIDPRGSEGISCTLEFMVCPKMTLSAIRCTAVLIIANKRIVPIIKECEKTKYRHHCEGLKRERERERERDGQNIVFHLD
jgi:hypothetical protein